MDWLDKTVTEFLGQYPVVKTIAGVLTTVLVFGRSRAWWNKKAGVEFKK